MRAMPPATTIRRLTTVVDQIAVGRRWYRRTPPALRRPEPALRLSLTGVSCWFASFFALLAYVAMHRTIGPADSTVGFVAVVGGYVVACATGVAAAICAFSRRYRMGGYMLGATVVIGQAVTVLAVA